MDPLESDVELPVQCLAEADLTQEFGQYVVMTPPETAADWREFLEIGYARTCEFLSKHRRFPVGEIKWIEHAGDEIYPGGTYGWKQSFAGRMD